MKNLTYSNWFFITIENIGTQNSDLCTWEHPEGPFWMRFVLGLTDYTSGRIPLVTCFTHMEQEEDRPVTKKNHKVYPTKYLLLPEKHWTECHESFMTRGTHILRQETPPIWLWTTKVTLISRETVLTVEERVRYQMTHWDVKRKQLTS